MKNYYEEELTVLPSTCNCDAKMKLSGLLDIFMDAAMMHAEDVGVGISDFRPIGKFWVAVKTRIRFNRPVNMAEKVTVKTWPEKPGKIACVRYYDMRKNDEILAVGKTDWVIIDTETKRIQRTEGIYPPDLVFSEECADDAPFRRLKDDCADEFFGKYTVRSVDIDYGNHMNNVAYVRAIEGLFSTNEWRDREYCGIEIQYKSSCYEKDEISFYKKETPEGTVIKAENNGECVMTAVLYAN